MNTGTLAPAETVDRSGRPTKTKTVGLRTGAGIALALLAAGAGYVAHLGYFGGPLYTLVPAQRRPAAAGAATVALLFSGDMGFNVGMGPRIARRLAADGIPVLGINSLTAFAKGGDAARAAAVVRAAVKQASALPGAGRLLLIGQSFGANIVLAGAPALPSRLRDRIAMVELVVPQQDMAFRATPGGLFDITHDGAALPYARRLAGMPVLCIHGETEAGSLCPLWHQPNVHVVALPGDHYLHRDDALVAATLLRAAHAALG